MAKIEKPELSIHNLKILERLTQFYAELYKDAAEAGPESKIDDFFWIDPKTGIEFEMKWPRHNWPEEYYKTGEGN